MGSGPMIVEVGFAIRDKPTEDHLGCLRRDAERLTDSPPSVAVRHVQTDDRHQLITTFTMPRTAQYKVVSDIAFRFTKMGFGCHHEYLDVWISFPKRPR